MESILLYTGCSRWTSSGRNHAVHIANENRQPLCGKKYENGATDVYDGYIHSVTCEKCQKKYLKEIKQINIKTTL